MTDVAEQLPAPNKIPTSKSKPSSTSEDAHNKLLERQSKEIVIALCGPIGCGAKSVKEQLYSVLQDEQYEVFHIRVSKEIEFLLEAGKHKITYDSSNKAERYNMLMNAGNCLRKSCGDAIGADLAVAKIAKLREGFADDGDDDSDFGQSKKGALVRRAYIVDQLKHPAEVKALKNVYGNIFYLVGVLCDEERRKISLSDEGITQKDANDLVLRDKKENFRHGQQLEKTLFHADFFINNSDPNASAARSLLDRFLKLAHGGRGITPTKEEYGMYSAYSASLQSGCLSRQVGASIMNKDGVVLAVGRNDVPKYGGGLYTEDDNIAPHTKDYRCVHRDQRCHNDLHKLKLRDKLAEILSVQLQNINSKVGIDDKVSADKLADVLYEGSQIKSLIEYSRAIHAEMDAIISLVKSSIGIPKNTTLLSTTFPCHNCARHIIAAGIGNVIYIEPYEKSLAISLHDDALSYSECAGKVLLRPFQGVAPSRYQVFFGNTTPKKDLNGRIIIKDRGDNLLVDKNFVDSYLERENFVAASVLKLFTSH